MIDHLFSVAGGGGLSGADDREEVEERRDMLLGCLSDCFKGDPFPFG